MSVNDDDRQHPRHHLRAVDEPPFDPDYDLPPRHTHRNIEAEQELLGALLRAPELAPHLADALDATDFSQPRHETLWHTIHALTADDTTPTPAVVLDRLQRDHNLKPGHLDGPYLHTLTAAAPGTPTLPGTQALAEIVLNAARLRAVDQIRTRLGQILTTARPDTIDQALETALDTLDAAVARSGATTPAATGIEYVQLPGLFTRPRTQVTWHIAPLIAAGRVTLLYSPGKTGKSLIAMEAAAALATGRAALATPATRQPVHVLYIDQEMTEDDWADRLADMGYGPDDEQLLAEHLHLAQLQSWPPMDTPAGGAAVHREAQRVGADVVIIDTASKVIAGEENSNDTAQAFYRNTLVGLKRAGTAVLVLDHTGKDLERGARGGSAKTDNIDLAFELLLRGRDLLTMRCSHARFRDDHLLEPTFLRRTSGPLAHLVEERTTTAGHGPGLRPTHLMEKVSKFVEYNPGASRKTIETAKLGKAEYVRMALELLLAEAYVSVEKGAHNAQIHRSIKPYREAEDD